MDQLADVLVIGSGLAGLSYALKVADFAQVNLVTKQGLTETSTSKAQGGIAAVLGPDDRFEYPLVPKLCLGTKLFAKLSLGENYFPRERENEKYVGQAPRLSVGAASSRPGRVKPAPTTGNWELATMDSGGRLSYIT